MSSMPTKGRHCLFGSSPTYEYPQIDAVLRWSRPGRDSLRSDEGLRIPPGRQPSARDEQARFLHPASMGDSYRLRAGRLGRDRRCLQCSQYEYILCQQLCQIPNSICDPRKPSPVSLARICRHGRNCGRCTRAKRRPNGSPISWRIRYRALQRPKTSKFWNAISTDRIRP